MCKTLKLGLLAFVMLGMTFLACDKLGTPTGLTPDNPGKVQASDFYYQTFTIWAGHHTSVGQIQLWNDYHNIYIKYVLDADNNWWLTAANTQVAPTLEGVPQQNGNPQPGQFAYPVRVIDPKVKEFTVTVPIMEPWRTAPYLVLAAHCIVQEWVDGHLVQTQNGWAGDKNFTGNDGATYCEFCCWKCLCLPVYGVTSQLVHADGEIPDQFHVWDVGHGFSIPDDSIYSSMCLDRNIYIYWSVYHPTYLWCSYNPFKPDYAMYNRGTTHLTPYDKMNYLLNKIMYMEHRFPPFTQEHLYQLQHIFWYYREIVTYDGLTEAEKLLVQDAEAHGNGFHPTCGMLTIVLLDNGETVQLTFIIVDP